MNIYPKRIMTITELVEMGYSKRMLRDMYHLKGYPYAFKETKTKTCPIKVNTAYLDKYLEAMNLKN